MKASLAAIMLAGREAVRLDLRGDVIVTAVADEEFASIGVRDVVATWAPTQRSSPNRPGSIFA